MVYGLQQLQLQLCYLNMKKEIESYKNKDQKEIIISKSSLETLLKELKYYKKEYSPKNIDTYGLQVIIEALQQEIKKILKTLRKKSTKKTLKIKTLKKR